MHNITDDHSIDDIRANKPRSRRENIASLFVSIALFGALGASAYISSARSSYSAGAANDDPAFIFSEHELIAVSTWFVSVGISLAIALAGPEQSRRMARWNFVALVGVTVAQCGFRQLPPNAYEAGFNDWTHRNINTAAIQAWNGTLPTVAARTRIPANAWPASIASLNPAIVEQLPSGQGVVIEWGVVSTWGTARRVIVGAHMPTTADEGRFSWRLYGDRKVGVLVGV